MAVDTENKRRSVAKVLPVPDGTVAAADRGGTVWMYVGIAFQSGISTISIKMVVAYNNMTKRVTEFYDLTRNRVQHKRINKIKVNVKD